MRALETLHGVSAIACEDTRVTGKLLAAHHVKVPMIAYHEHNAARRRPEIVSRIQAGESVALVSDAGTPLISDPGYKLVRAVRDEGLPVTALPGPSAALAALVVSGLPSDRFFFQGFLPSKSKARRDALDELRDLRASLIFYESPRRLAVSLADMMHVLGDREAAVARELTKRFEEVRRAPLSELAQSVSDDPPRGEVVVVVAPPEDRTGATCGEDAAGAALDEGLRAALAAGSLRDAVDEVAARTGVPRKAVYRRALALKDGDE